MINENEFCHLHIHHELSLLDSLGTSRTYAQKAKQYGNPSLAITDHGNISGIIEHQRQCKEHGIKPIFGVELYCVEDHLYRPEKGEKEKRGHLTVWVKNDTGYKNLLKILSASHIYGFYYRNRVGYDLLLDNCEGLVIGTACSGSFLNYGKGIEFFHRLRKKVGNKSIFLEIMPHDFEEQHKHNKLCFDLHEETGVRMISSNDCHFENKEDSESHEVLLCIQSKKKWKDPDRWKFPCDTFYYTPAKEMLTMWENQSIIPIEKAVEAMKNTMIVSDMCNLEIRQKAISLPKVPRWKDLDENDVLIELCEQGMKNKLGLDIDLKSLVKGRGL